MSDETTAPEPQEPTIAGFMARVGEPALTFAVPNDGIAIPPGLLSCCRVVHAPHCAHHVAGSVLGVAYTLTGHGAPNDDDGDDAWTAERSHNLGAEGDILAEPNRLWAHVRAVWAVVQENARVADAQVSELTFAVFTLGAERWAEWKYLEGLRLARGGAHLDEQIRDSDDLPDDRLAALPIRIVAEAEDEEAEEEQEIKLARVMAGARFRPVLAYAHRILTVPGEIGHDDEARYAVETTLPPPREEPMPYLPEAGAA